MLEQQWLTMYRETVHPLYGYMAKRTAGNRELTEDIVQECYLRALDHWSLKTVPDSPLAWLKVEGLLRRGRSRRKRSKSESG